MNWSVLHGDLRVAHFFALQAVQVLPLLAWGMLRLDLLRPVRTIVLLVVIGGLGALRVGTLVQALAGRPFLLAMVTASRILSRAILSVVPSTAAIAFGAVLTGCSAPPDDTQGNSDEVRSDSLAPSVVAGWYKTNADPPVANGIVYAKLQADRTYSLGVRTGQGNSFRVERGSWRIEREDDRDILTFLSAGRKYLVSRTDSMGPLVLRDPGTGRDTQTLEPAHPSYVCDPPSDSNQPLAGELVDTVTVMPVLSTKFKVAVRAIRRPSEPQPSAVATTKVFNESSGALRVEFEPAKGAAEADQYGGEVSMTPTGDTAKFNGTLALTNGSGSIKLVAPCKRVPPSDPIFNESTE